MHVWIVLLVLLLVLFGMASAAMALRRPSPTPPIAMELGEAVDEARRERRRAAVALGSELVDRRVQLDARRGPLQGDADVLGALDGLEGRRRAGEISDTEFEDQKTRILGG